MALIWNEHFFFNNGGKIYDVSEKNMMTVGTLRCSVTPGSDKMGFVASIAERMGKVLDKNTADLDALYLI